MNKVINSLLVGGVLLISLSSCVQKNSIKLFNEQKKLTYNVGKKDNAIETLIFTSDYQTSKTHQISFHIDKYPFIKIFDTCHLKKMMEIEEIKYKNNGETLLETGIPLSCKSRIAITKNNNQYSGEYSFIFLDNMRPYKKGSNYVYPTKRPINSNYFTIRKKKLDIKIVYDNYWSKL